jgi:hypothetical protein
MGCSTFFYLNGLFLFLFQTTSESWYYTIHTWRSWLAAIVSHTEIIILLPFSIGSKRQFYRNKHLHVFGAYRDRYGLKFFGAVAEGDQWGADALNGSLTHGVGDPGLYDGHATA